ncbi:hypothetical protein [Agrobacterium larrymoorei]|uniref:Helix-turn-helix domain-containing protein n=1 Tax=Agrobacterium larrymoorei TaxID=160699 RepID=A0AAF0H4M6_9HYPH|nr:hypothetical protein [Agrobacterium larrymoorei]WHA40174.1 hypothetical protein CFBP5477_010035 [Agrobacterium larrymoorei]
MLSNDNSIYYVVGMIPINPEGPGFCTPVFRDDAGKKYFLQSMRMRRKVEAFVHVGDHIPPSAFFSYRPNGEFRAGDRPYVGFRLPNGSLLFDRRPNVQDQVISRIDELTDYPFIYFQIARLSRSADLIKRALCYPEVDTALKNGWIRLKPNEPRFGWTAANEKELRLMSRDGHSAATIARKLGTSRNSVIAKLKRLRIGSRYLDDRQQNLFDDLPKDGLVSGSGLRGYTYKNDGFSMQFSGNYSTTRHASETDLSENERQFLGRNKPKT